MIKFIALFLVILFNVSAYAAMPDLDFTVTMDEPVIVDTASGTPRIQIDVGGKTRYARYASGSGTSALTFTYAPTAGDADLDGVALTSPLELNGGAITDLSGNAITNLNFSAPDTSGVSINYPSLSMNFTTDADGQYSLNGTVYNDLSSFLTAVGGSFTRTSAATYVNASGVLQEATSGTLRFDHVLGTGTPKGVLLEEASENKILNSQDLSTYSVNGGTLTHMPDEVGPDGQTGNVYRLTLPASGGTYFSLGTFTSTDHTISIYAKEYGATQNQFSLFLGGGQTSQNMTATSNWMRYSYTYTRANSLNGVNNGDDTYVTDILIAFPQIEEGTAATSYIPTSGSAVARAADALEISTSSGWFNTSEGSFLSEMSFQNAASSQAQGVALSALGDQGYLFYKQANTTNFFAFTNDASRNLASISSDVTFKAIIGYDGSDAIASYNGALSSTISDVVSNSPTAIRKYGNFAGHIEKIQYYPQRHNDSTLNALTTP